MLKLVHDYLIVYVLFLAIFFSPAVRVSHSQETKEVTDIPSVNTQQKDVSSPYRSEQQTNQPLPSQGKVKRNFYRRTPYTSVLDKSGNIYLAFPDGTLTAIDPDGNTKWNIHMGDKINAGFTIGSDNALYFSSGKTLYAISSSGILEWTFNADNMVAFPAVLDNQGNIYIVTKKDNFLYAIRKDGSLCWQVHINNISTQPSIAHDGTIYIAARDSMFYAINSEGLLRWKREIYGRKVNQVAAVSETVDIVRPEVSYQLKEKDELQKQNTQGVTSEHQDKTEEIQVSPKEIEPPIRPESSYQSKEKDELRLQGIQEMPSELKEKTGAIQAAPKETDTPAITSFEASVRSGAPPLTVRFSDSSSGKVINRLWDFGDGTPEAIEQQPIHRYTKPGNYDVCLIIDRSDNTLAIKRQKYIVVTNPRESNINENNVNPRESKFLRGWKKKYEAANINENNASAKERDIGIPSDTQNFLDDAKITDETFISAVNPKNP